MRDPDAARGSAPGFAREAFVALHAYDTRFARDEWRRRLLSRLGVAESSLAAQDAERLIPDTAQWAQMAAVGQRASAAVGSAYVPALWRDTVAEHPGLPDGAVGVTVTGTQSVSWDGGSSRVPVAITLLLLCPPATERCVVSRITAQVAQ